MAFNRESQLKKNIEAIKIALEAKVSGREPKKEDIAKLRQYGGFGGLKCVLRQAESNYDAASWPKTDARLFTPTMELNKMLYDYSTSDQEYKSFRDSLRASVLTSFYTPRPVVDAISEAVKEAGLKVYNFLDPSAGQGVFIDSFAKQNPGMSAVACEKDILTSLILKATHGTENSVSGRKVDIHAAGFETIDKSLKGKFDVVSSNIPFGDFAVADPEYATSKNSAYRQSAKTIHNYFFLKALDQTREGGIVAFITSQGVMNASSPFVRMEMMKHANLVSAVRLPNNTFTEIAGTSVGSDLIILQKHSDKKQLSHDEELFVESSQNPTTKLVNNKFFESHPERIVHTDSKLGTDQYGKPAMTYIHSGGATGIANDLKSILATDIEKNLNKNLYNNLLSLPNKIDEKPKKEVKSEVKTEAKSEIKYPGTQREPDSLWKQFTEMKKKHPDAILLFRVGDFYETFKEDAVKASSILGLTLTHRTQGSAGRVELAGFPHHALDTYLPKLVRAGQRVAICEQLNDPQ